MALQTASLVTGFPIALVMVAMCSRAVPDRLCRWRPTAGGNGRIPMSDPSAMTIVDLDGSSIPDTRVRAECNVIACMQHGCRVDGATNLERLRGCRRLADRGRCAVRLWRRIIRENEKAHAAITENVRELDKKIDTVAAGLDKKIDTVAAGLDKKIDTVAAGLDKKIDALDTKIDTVAAKIDAVANDVAFLAGRRAERDRG